MEMQLLKDVIIIGSIKSDGLYIGGIIGAVVGGNISQCSNEASVTGKASVGGIVGYSEVVTETAEYVNINLCNNKAIITSTDVIYESIFEIPYYATNTGGIVGIATKTNIASCKNNQIVNSTADTTARCIGGIAGDLRNGTISQCINEKGGIIGTQDKYICVGGIVGYAVWQATIEDCCNMEEIKGSWCIGGIAGCTVHTKTSYCYNCGNIKGTTEIAGIIGEAAYRDNSSIQQNSIQYCYNRGSIIGNDIKGSVIGYTYSSNDYLYALKGTCGSIFGKSDGEVGTHQNNNLEKADLVSTIISTEFNNHFKEDYTGKENINEGFPILSWQ